MSELVQDKTLQKAIAGINQRSERQENVSKIVETFVDVGILPQLENRNSQVFYGRRGTGKTHVLRVLRERLETTPDNLVVYVDMRTLGSTALATDGSLSARRRSLSILRDLLNLIQPALLDYALGNPDRIQAGTIEVIHALVDTINAPTRTKTGDRITARRARSQHSDGQLDIGFGAGSGVSYQRGTSGATEDETLVELHLEDEDKIIIPSLYSELSRALAGSHLHLTLLLDEWSSVPNDIQPHVAELIKRTLIPIQQVTIKIAALEYRSSFLRQTESGLLGLELGSDIATAPDLDDYYVFDRNKEQVVSAFAEILYRHIAAECSDAFLVERYSIHGPDDLVRKLFTEKNTFVELVRASEGVVRDLISVFTRAFFDSQRRGRVTIDIAGVVEGARQWFEQDKARNLDERLQETLSRIVGEVIGHRRARSFLLQRQLEQHPVIQRLFDARVLHLVQRGYADKDNPGRRYNIYTLDYGTYLDLLATSKAPDGVLDSGESRADLVPLDDKRSIRRIVLEEEVLNEALGSDERNPGNA